MFCEVLCLLPSQRLPRHFHTSLIISRRGSGDFLLRSFLEALPIAPYYKPATRPAYYPAYCPAYPLCAPPNTSLLIAGLQPALTPAYYPAYCLTYSSAYFLLIALPTQRAVHFLPFHLLLASPLI